MANSIYEFGPFRLDASERLLCRGKKRIKLTSKAFGVLLTLVQRPNHICSTQDLLDAVWPDQFVEPINVQKNVYTLRRTLGGEREQYIETVPGIGYRFVAEVKGPAIETPLVGTKLPAATMAGKPSFAGFAGSALFDEASRLEEEAAELEEWAAEFKERAARLNRWAARRRVRASLLRETTINQNVRLNMLERSSKEERAKYVFDVALGASQELKGAAQAGWFHTLEAIHSELIAALDHYHDHGSADEELRFVVSVAPFWEICGHSLKGIERLQLALARQQPISSSLKAQGLASLGALLCNQNEYRRAKQPLLESVKISRKTGDKECLALSLLWLSNASEVQGDYPQAKIFLEEGLSASKEIRSDWLIAKGVRRLGRIAEAEGNYPAAKEHHTECLRRSQYIDDSRYIASALSDLSTIAREYGNHNEARRHLEKSLALRQCIGHKWGIGDSYLNLGFVEQSAGRHQDAEKFFRQSLAVFQEIGNKHEMARAMEGIGCVTLTIGHESGGALMLGAANEIRSTIGSPLSPNDRKKYGHILIAARKNDPGKWKTGQSQAADIVANIVRQS